MVCGVMASSVSAMKRECPFDLPSGAGFSAHEYEYGSLESADREG
jgi:hypothetical protein